jgi:asparagine synthetase A
MESMESRLWDIITEFHFLLKDVSKWDWDDVMLIDKLNRLHAKLKEMILEIIFESIRQVEKEKKHGGET